MNKKLIALTFGLASLVSGCVTTHRSHENHEVKPVEYRKYESMNKLIEPPNYVMPRYDTRKR